MFQSWRVVWLGWAEFRINIDIRASLGVTDLAKKNEKERIEIEMVVLDERVERRNNDNE